MKQTGEIMIIFIHFTPSAGVREMLERCEFYDKTDKAILYVSVHDAVLGALADQPELLNKVRYHSRVPIYCLASLGALPNPSWVKLIDHNYTFIYRFFRHLEIECLLERDLSM